MTLWTDEWRSRRLAHERRVDGWVVPYLHRRSRRIAHPVEDFLFTYYTFSPAALRRWHPGFGTRLLGDGLGFLSEVKGYDVQDSYAEGDPRLAVREAATIERIRHLLVATQSRPMVLGCFGLHEWAMVYRQSAEERRHASYPLRLGGPGTDSLVERHRIACTHYDAFRFFTPQARPLNAVQPTRASQADLEQPGCLHATMDLYKWAFKLSPFTSAELVADCFTLAREVRLVDMQASPYDLSALGVEPLRIETAAGKAEYVAAQRSFAEQATPLRERLIDVCDQVLRAA